jgi:putative membrane protein
VTTFSALIGLTIFKLYIPKEMTLEILFKYLHFICIFAIVSAIVGQHLLLKPQLTRAEIKRLATLDAVYGVAVILLLAAGFSLWFWVGKPAEFYSKNWIFHLKIGLFVIVGLLSIYPTVFFNKQKKGPESDLVDIPPSIKYMIRLELLLLFIMPLTASLMAKGIGYFGE